VRQALEHVGPMIGGDVLRRPAAGDMALFEIEEVSVPRQVLDATGKEQPLRRGDHVLGVFGNCQAADTLEARVSGLDDLSLMSRMGLVGTVRQSLPLARAPTRVSFLGYGLDPRGERLNLKALLFNPCRLRVLPANIFLVVGAGPGSGEGTALAHLRAGLAVAGLSVAVCRLTRPKPTSSTAVGDGPDLADYGFLSSYGCSTGELRALFHTMLADLAWARPDVVLVAVAGGILQREAARVLSDPEITRHVRGVLLTAACATSALFALRWLGSRRHRVVAVSGVLSSAPLLVREFREWSEVARVPVGSVDGVGRQLVHVLLDELDELDEPGGARRGLPVAAAGGSAAPASARLPVPRWRRAGGGAGG
jgi:NAD(P)-dependent dehydrogenase (short-subunit alcohol dehydrogenase family)